MRRWILLVGVLCGLAGTARAGFELNYVVQSGTGALSGDTIFLLYAKNDQTGDQAGSKKLVAFDIHIKPLSGSLIFDFEDLDDDSLPDANITGIGMTASSVKGTYLRAGSAAAFVRAYSTPSIVYSSDGDPVAAFTGVTDFNVGGFSSGTNAPVATQGLGALYGAAVVPEGVDVNVSGKVAAEIGVGVGTGPLALDGPVAAPPPDIGPDFPFNFTAQAPEPGSLAIFGLTGGLLFLRRRHGGGHLNDTRLHTIPKENQP